MNSFWKNTVVLSDYESLNKNVNVDVAIIGGGISGILTAYKLKEEGLNPVIFESGKICGGTSGFTTGKISLAHGLIYAQLLNDFGIEKAREYARSCEKGIEDYKKMIESNHIDCDFEQCSAYLYSTVSEDILIDEYDALIECGIDCKYLSSDKLPRGFKGAIKYNKQGKFNPLKFINHILKDLTIYENTRIETIKEKRKILLTNKGFKIKANKIVFACGFPFLNFPGFYFMRMHQERSYFLVLENNDILKDIYFDIDNGYSFRQYEKYLLFGGAKHRCGENSEGGQYNLLRDKIKEFYKHSKEIYHYSSQDCMSIDKVPYIGQLSKGLKDIYVLTGFNKWGLTHAMYGSEVIKDMITKNLNNDKSIFSPERFDTKDISKSVIKEGPHVIKGIGREYFNLPDTELHELSLGHGGIVEYNGEKIGVYKDTDGSCYMVSVKCPHLGCELVWNPDEKSWDCPCHGSRFDYKGNVITGPSVYKLDFVKR